MARVRSGVVVLLSAASALVGAATAVRVMISRQAAIARRRIGKPLGEEAPGADRIWRPAQKGEPLDLLLLGDSVAAGLGASRPRETLGARIAKGLAKRKKRPVRLRVAAVVGSESPDLDAQIDELPADYQPRVAVIVVGGNDVTHRLPLQTSLQHLEDAITRLHARGTKVIVGTCPDLGTLRPVPQPLRSLIGRLSRRLAAEQAETAARCGAVAVDLRRAVGALFLREPDEMFSLDRFHPSALGYHRTADALLPAVIAAV